MEKTLLGSQHGTFSITLQELIAGCHSRSHESGVSLLVSHVNIFVFTTILVSPTLLVLVLPWLTGIGD